MTFASLTIFSSAGALSASILAFVTLALASFYSAAASFASAFLTCSAFAGFSSIGTTFSSAFAYFNSALASAFSASAFDSSAYETFNSFSFFSAGVALFNSALAAAISKSAILTSLMESFTSSFAYLTSASASTAGTKPFFLATTLFFVTGTLMTSYFSSPVVESLVVTTLFSYSTTGTTSWVAF